MVLIILISSIHFVLESVMTTMTMGADSLIFIWNCSGAFSNVYKALDLRTDKKVAGSCTISPSRCRLAHFLTTSVKVVHKYELSVSQVRLLFKSNPVGPCLVLHCIRYRHWEEAREGPGRLGGWMLTGLALFCPCPFSFTLVPRTCVVALTALQAGDKHLNSKFKKRPRVTEVRVATPYLFPFCLSFFLLRYVSTV